MNKKPIKIYQTNTSTYLINLDNYENMQERKQILEGIARGETAILEGRVYTNSEAKRKMKKWLNRLSTVNSKPLLLAKS